jgi:hypothetical protein
MQVELVVVDDQARVAVDRHQRRVVRARHQHVELPARPARAVVTGEPFNHPRLLGNAFGDWRQSARLHLLGEHRGFLQGRQRIGGQGLAADQAEEKSLSENASFHPGRSGSCNGFSHDRAAKFDALSPGCCRFAWSNGTTRSLPCAVAAAAHRPTGPLKSGLPAEETWTTPRCRVSTADGISLTFTDLPSSHRHSDCAPITSGLTR